jgi:hypothetical protein
MVYTSTPDSAVFKVSGHTISTPIEVGPHGDLIVSITGETLRKIMHRVDSASFFRDGEKMAGSPEAIR